MAFIESPRFPDGIAFIFSGGPRFSTDIVVNAGGYESRNQNWAQARGRWECGHAPKNRANSEVLAAFFRNAAGRANGFRFKDWSDYSATVAEGVFTSLGNNQYQMCKRYTIGALSHDRIISKPILETISVTGFDIGSPSIHELDPTTGILTVGGSGDSPSTWAGEFDVPARFDSDDMVLQLLESNPHLYSWGDIAIVELRGE